MKKIILCLLTLSLILSGLTACTGTPAETDVPQADKDLLLQNWEDVLEVMETTQVHFLWSLDYLDTFAADNNWGSLLKARAACLAAAQTLENVPLPELTLSEEQYQTLMDGQIDAELVKTEFLVLNNSVQESLVTFNMLDLMLHEDVFYKSIASELHTWSDIQRKLTESIAQYYCYATNYLLLQIGMPEAWEELAAKYPTLFSSVSEWIETEEGTQVAVVNALDQYEDLLMQVNEFHGRFEYTLALVKEAVETGNLEYLAQEVHTVDEVPCYILTPDWLLDEDVNHKYLVTDPNTQNKAVVESGEKIENIPSAYYSARAGVSLEEVQDYAQQLADCGFQVSAGWETEGETYHVFWLEGDSRLLVEWTEENTIYYMSGSLACMTTVLRLYTQYGE